MILSPLQNMLLLDIMGQNFFVTLF